MIDVREEYRRAVREMTAGRTMMCVALDGEGPITESTIMQDLAFIDRVRVALMAVHMAIEQNHVEEWRVAQRAKHGGVP